MEYPPEHHSSPIYLYKASWALPHLCEIPEPLCWPQDVFTLLEGGCPALPVIHQAFGVGQKRGGAQWPQLQDTFWAVADKLGKKGKSWGGEEPFVLLHVGSGTRRSRAKLGNLAGKTQNTTIPSPTLLLPTTPHPLFHCRKGQSRKWSNQYVNHAHSAGVDLTRTQCQFCRAVCS